MTCPVTQQAGIRTQASGSPSGFTCSELEATGGPAARGGVIASVLSPGPSLCPHSHTSAQSSLIQQCVSRAYCAPGPDSEEGTVTGTDRHPGPLELPLMPLTSSLHLQPSETPGVHSGACHLWGSGGLWAWASYSGKTCLDSGDSSFLSFHFSF